MDCLVDIDRKLLLGLDSGRECLFPFLHLIGGLLRAKLVVDYFECAGFFDSTIGSGAIRTVDDFTCHVVDGFRKGLSLHVFEIWSAEAFDEYAAVRFLEQNACTGLLMMSLQAV
jgi:hypothetical protein